MATLPDTIPFGSTPIAPVNTSALGGNQTPANADTISFGSPPIAPALTQNHTLGDTGNLLKNDVKGLSQVLTNIEQPFVSVAATPVQMLAKGLGQPDPYANNAFPAPNGQGVPVAPVTPAGFLQKAGQVAQIGSLVASGGATSIGSLTALGAASGAAQSVAEGNLTKDPGQVLKDTIYGSMFGFGLGVTGKFLHYMGSMEQAKTGVTGAVQDSIANANPDTVAAYIDASKVHGETLSELGKPTSVALAENEFDSRASQLGDILKNDAGPAVGEARKAAGALPITLIDKNGTPLVGQDAVNHIADTINNAMQEMTGHQLASYGSAQDLGVNIVNYPEGASMAGIPSANESGIIPLPGRSIDLSKSEIKQLENLQLQIEKLRASPNVQTASDVLVNINNDIGKWQMPEFGKGNTPVEGLLKFAEETINGSIAPAAPELADANSVYSMLKNVQRNIGAQAGQTGQSSALLMRRVLSGDKSNSVVPLLNQIDSIIAPGANLTELAKVYRSAEPTVANDFFNTNANNLLKSGKIDSTLVQHSVLSDWATSMFGNESTRQLLSKAVSEGNTISKEGTSIFGYAKQYMNYLVQGSIRAISPYPEAYAMAVSRGEQFSLNPLVRFLDEQVDNVANVPVLGAITKGLKTIGVSATNLEAPAKTLLKIYLMQQLTRTNQYTPPVGAPNTLPAPNTVGL